MTSSPLFELPPKVVAERERLTAERTARVQQDRRDRQQQLIDRGRHPIGVSTGYSIPQHTDRSRTCGSCEFYSTAHHSGDPKCAHWGSSRTPASSLDPAWSACAAHVHRTEDQ